MNRDIEFNRRGPPEFRRPIGRSSEIFFETPLVEALQFDRFADRSASPRHLGEPFRVFRRFGRPSSQPLHFG